MRLGKAQHFPGWFAETASPAGPERERHARLPGRFTVGNAPDQKIREQGGFTGFLCFFGALNTDPGPKNKGEMQDETMESCHSSDAGFGNAAQHIERLRQKKRPTLPQWRPHRRTLSPVTVLQKRMTERKMARQRPRRKAPRRKRRTQRSRQKRRR